MEWIERASCDRLTLSCYWSDRVFLKIALRREEDREEDREAI